MGKDEVIGEMLNGGGDKVVDWIWRLCNMTFKSGVVPEEWRSAVIIPLYKGKGERTEYSNYRGISLSMVGNIYEGIQVDRIHKVNKGLIDDKQGGFRARRRGYVDQIFTLKQIGEKAQKKM